MGETTRVPHCDLTKNVFRGWAVPLAVAAARELAEAVATLSSGAEFVAGIRFAAAGSPVPAALVSPTDCGAIAFGVTGADAVGRVGSLECSGAFRSTACRSRACAAVAADAELAMARAGVAEPAGTACVSSTCDKAGERSSGAIGARVTEPSVAVGGVAGNGARSLACGHEPLVESNCDHKTRNSNPAVSTASASLMVVGNLPVIGPRWRFARTKRLRVDAASGSLFAMRAAVGMGRAAWLNATRAGLAVLDGVPVTLAFSALFDRPSSMPCEVELRVDVAAAETLVLPASGDAGGFEQPNESRRSLPMDPIAVAGFLAVRVLDTGRGVLAVGCARVSRFDAKSLAGGGTPPCAECSCTGFGSGLLRGVMIWLGLICAPASIMPDTQAVVSAPRLRALHRGCDCTEALAKAHQLGGEDGCATRGTQWQPPCVSSPHPSEVCRSRAYRPNSALGEQRRAGIQLHTPLRPLMNDFFTSATCLPTTMIPVVSVVPSP